MSDRPFKITDYNGVTLDYSLEEFEPAFDALPLPVRMRVAAKVLGKVNDREHYGMKMTYGPQKLWELADAWEREATEHAEVQELARELFSLIVQLSPPTHYDAARKLYDAGYRKVQEQ